MPYAQLLAFGVSPINSLIDPVARCIGVQMFDHGSKSGQNSPECQLYLAQRCASKWDNACEIASNQNGTFYTRNVPVYADGSQSIGIDTGDLMIRNSAMEKYRIGMRNDPFGSHICKLVTEQFNPTNPVSKNLTHYEGDCIGEYAVNPFTIDSDPIMNKILDRPHIFLPLLFNIRNTMVKNGTITLLAGTRLGNFLEVGR